MRMGSYEAWLAAMPIDDVRRRIGQLERELDVLKLLEAQHHGARDRPVRLSDSDPVPPVVQQPAFSTRRLSPQRMAIIRLIRDHPHGLGPNDVAQQLGVEPNAAQTTMSRMVSAGE